MIPWNYKLFSSTRDKLTSEVVTLLNESNRKYSLLFLVGDLNKPKMELSTFTQGDIRKLHIQQSVGESNRSFLYAKHDLPLCLHLTHLSLTSSKLVVDNSVFKVLSKAVQDGKLPNLCHLSLRNHSNTDKNLPPLPLLFQTQWPSLTHLDLIGCKLVNTDIQIVFGATDLSHTNHMPNLSSLAISSRYFRKSDSLFSRPWTNFSSLEFSDTGSST